MDNGSVIHHDLHSESPAVAKTDLGESINQVRETGYLETIRKLRLDLADKSDLCELLRIKLDESDRAALVLNQELDECKMAIFENKECAKKIHEEAQKSKKIEEDYVKLMSEFLDLGEQSVQYKQTLVDNYVAKSNIINNVECFISSGAVNKELEDCKQDLDQRLVELNLAQAKVKHLEEENSSKEKSIHELKRALDEAKIARRHELDVLEKHIFSLKTTITSYERNSSDHIDTKLKEGSI